MKKISEKALEYAQKNEKPCFYEPAIHGYVTGYIDARKENPYRWRDPRKERPECFGGLKFEFVLAAIDRGGYTITEIVQYIEDGSNSRWREFRRDEIVDHPTDKIKAWMPKPNYSE